MAVFPDPPFFYKLFDDPESEVFKELNVPPEIPDKRIVFGEEETDALPDVSIDDKRDSISCVVICLSPLRFTAYNPCAICIDIHLLYFQSVISEN